MVDEISTDDVKEKLEADGDVQVVDIRPPEQFAEGHIPGAMNIPMNELPARVQEHEWGDEIVVACPIGQSSIQAARLLQSYEGVDGDAAVASMAGGYDDWEYELESEDELEA